MKKWLVWLLVLAVLFCGCSRVKKTEHYDRNGAGEGQADVSLPRDDGLREAPDFTVYDISGKAVKLSDFQGKGVVLNFWATWCPPCKAELPDFQAEYDRWGDQVHFLFVNMTDGAYETASTVREFIDSSGYTFPVYLDLDFQAANGYAITAIPTTYFINARGKIVSYTTGMMDAQALGRGIDSILE